MQTNQTKSAKRVQSERDDRGIRTRERLFMSLLHEAGAVGYERASVSGILQRARCSKGSFYHHFRNKDDLLLKGLDAHTRKTRNLVLNSEPARTAAPEELICADIARVLSELETVQVMRGFTELKLLAGRNAKMAALFLPDQAAKIDLLAKVVRAGQRSGVYRRDVSADTAAEVIYAGIFGAYYVALSTASDATLAGLVAIAQANVRFVFAALKREQRVERRSSSR